MAEPLDITRRIAAEREDLDRNLHELQARARSAVDWRHHVRRHPLLSVGIALGAGVAVAAMHRGSGRATAPSRATPDDGAHRSRGLGAVGEALVAAAGTAALGLLRDALPGFGEQYDRRRALAQRPTLATSGREN